MKKAGLIIAAIVAGLLAVSSFALADGKDHGCVSSHGQTYTEPAIGHVGFGVVRQCNVVKLPVPVPVP